MLVLGTLYQTSHGLFRAQEMFYRSYLTMYPLGDTGLIVPLPGARLLMLLLFVNMLLATMRMTFRRSVIGVYIVHIGILVLLAGGFVTAYGSYEGYMDLKEGDAANFSTRFNENEIAITREDGPTEETVTAIRHIERVPAGGFLYRRDDQVPFDVQMLKLWPNSMVEVDAEGTFASREGVNDPDSRQFAIRSRPPGPSEARFLSGIFRIQGDNGLDVTCILSDSLISETRVEVDGVTYRVSLRKRRDYYPFTIYLQDFERKVHPGTQVPRSFASKVVLVDPGENLERQVRIYMNHPLRYWNCTFYQASFRQNETVSVLQVVKNRGMVFPYIATVIVSVGLILQFAYVLVSRAALRRQVAAPE